MVFAPIGPYSKFLRAPLNSQAVYFAGVIGLNPDSGNIDATNFEDELIQLLKNIDSVLAEAKVVKENIIKVTVFLDSMNDFASLNTIYAKYFGEHKPTRSTVEVRGLPKKAKVEIEILAYVPLN